MSELQKYQDYEILDGLAPRKAEFYDSDDVDALIAKLEAQLAMAQELLTEAREDVVTQLDNYAGLLPYKKHRYDAQKETLDRIDKFLKGE